MTQASYRFARRKLLQAANYLHEAHTVYEGLAAAYLQALRRIDPDRDLPPNLRYLTRALLERFPFSHDPGATTHRGQANDVRAALRTLEPDGAKALARHLFTLSDLVTSHSKRDHLIGPDSRSIRH